MRHGAALPSRLREGQRDLRACSLVAAGWAIASLLPTPNPSRKREGRSTSATGASCHSVQTFVIPGLIRGPRQRLSNGNRIKSERGPLRQAFRFPAKAGAHAAQRCVFGARLAPGNACLRNQGMA